MKILHCLLILAAFPGPANAIDPGTVKGTFELNGNPIKLTHAYAHLHDNAEGLLDRPRELRILFTDREVPRETLHGLVFLPIESMATEGKVEGLLLEMDPAIPNSMVSTLLKKPSEPGASLMRTTYSVTGTKLFKRWKFDPQRVVGAIDRLDKPNPDFPERTTVSFALEFSAPVFNEPRVTADFKGKAALKSPPVQAMTALSRLMAAGDLAGARAYHTERARRQFDIGVKATGLDAVKMAKLGGAESKRMASRVTRVVVRGDRAVAMIGKSEWFTMVRESGRWKVDL